MEEHTVQHENRKARRKSRHGFWAGTVLGGVLGILLVGVLFSTSGAASAAGRLLGASVHPHQFGHPPSPEAMREHTDFAVDWVLSRIEADDSQRERARAIVGNAIDDLFPLMAQHQDNRKAFAAQLSAPTIDREALEELRLAELQLAEQASRRFVATLADLAEVLTPEQRTELIELAQRFHRD